MEYIGGGGAALSDVPVMDSSAFHFYFILAFATDASTTDGNFNATWQPRLSPDNIAAVKAAHPNIKFSFSIGGGNPSAIFQPTSLASWIKNAVASLSVIISDYHLSGIDIDFESFGGGSSPDDFASCIGQLITQLKQRNLIEVASIAPYPSTDTYYTKLWSTYNNTIDYVNYQFYSQGNMSVSEYVNVYKDAKSMYSGGTVLASFETVNNGTSIVPASGLEGCKELKEIGELNGIFIWSADQSYKNFQYEKDAQSLLESVAPPLPSPAPSQFLSPNGLVHAQSPTPNGPLPNSNSPAPNGPLPNSPAPNGPLASTHQLLLSFVVTLGFLPFL